MFNIKIESSFMMKEMCSRSTPIRNQNKNHLLFSQQYHVCTMFSLGFENFSWCFSKRKEKTRTHCPKCCFLLQFCHKSKNSTNGRSTRTDKQANKEKTTIPGRRRWTGESSWSSDNREKKLKIMLLNNATLK